MLTGKHSAVLAILSNARRQIEQMAIDSKNRDYDQQSYEVDVETLLLINSLKHFLIEHATELAKERFLL